ncbi:MAG: glycosyltransferase family 39 protein [Bryobacteraceae bacterium]
MALALAAIGAGAAAFVHQRGWTLYYGDAEAHLNIARRLVDSRTSGVHQLGTVWLPLPHLLVAWLAREDNLWHSGVAGVAPSVAAFVFAGVFLFLALRRLAGSTAAALAGVAVFALNPNLLYLQAIPMTEPLALACLLGQLYCLVRFHESQLTRDALLAGLCALSGTLTRYELWFLVPFAALFLLWRGGKARWRSALVYCVLASAGPLWWLAHNWWFYGDALEFWRGEWSARAIYQRQLDRGMARYPGDGDWALAARYYLEAARLCCGLPLFWLSLAGVAAALRRFPAALLFVLMIPAFFVLSLRSSGTPIFVPHLWPFSYYNTRYGIAWIVVAALGTAALAALFPPRWQKWAALAIVAAAVSPWILAPRPDAWICWKESEVNSISRRRMAAEAAAFLQPRHRDGAGILLSFGDLTAVLRLAHIPIRESLHVDDRLEFETAVARPDLFLREEWVLCNAGDRACRAVARLGRGPRRYECVKILAARDAPGIEIWRRIGSFVEP